MESSRADIGGPILQGKGWKHGKRDVPGRVNPGQVGRDGTRLRDDIDYTSLSALPRHTYPRSM